MKNILFFAIFLIFQISICSDENSEEKIYVDYLYNNRFFLKKHRTIKVSHLGKEGKIFKVPSYMYEGMIIVYYLDIVDILGFREYYGFKLKMYGRSVGIEKTPWFNEDIHMFCFEPGDEKTDKFVVLENQFKQLRTEYSILNPNQPNWPPLL